MIAGWINDLLNWIGTLLVPIASYSNKNFFFFLLIFFLCDVISLGNLMNTHAKECAESTMFRLHYWLLGECSSHRNHSCLAGL